MAEKTMAAERRKEGHQPLVRVVRKNDMPTYKSTLLRIGAFAVALIAGGLFILCIGLNPLDVYGTILKGSFRTSMAIQATVKIAVPLLICSLGLTFAFKMNFWNIGAEGQIPDSEIPVRQMLEQIVAKLGIPPFMLGLNWSSTERMSAQQADALTSELEAYRRILTPVIERIGNTALRWLGGGRCTVEWDEITLQDEVEHARARLYHAQADSLIRQQALTDGGEQDDS